MTSQHSIQDFTPHESESYHKRVLHHKQHHKKKSKQREWLKRVRNTTTGQSFNSLSDSTTT